MRDRRSGEPYLLYTEVRRESSHSGELGVILAVLVIVACAAIGLFLFLRRNLGLVHLGSGRMKADGSEQPIIIFEATDPFTLSGWVNLKEMQDGDKMVVKEYVKLGIDKEYGSWGGREFEGKQTDPMLRISPENALYGLKITIQQTLGTYRYFEWEFYRGRV